MKFDESVIGFLNKLNVLCGAEVRSIPAQLRITETLEHELRSLEVIRMNEEIQIGKFSLCNPAIHHERNRRAFQDRHFDATRCKCADNFGESACELKVLRYLGEVMCSDKTENFAGNSTLLEAVR